MKRPICDLTDAECDIVLQRFDLPTKRLLVQHASCGDTEVTVHNSAALFRDVASIICTHLDLQSWGRLRRTCSAFRLTKHAKWDELSALFAEKVDSKTVVAWNRQARNCKRTCQAFFRAAVRRFLFSCYGLMQREIDEFCANPPPPLVIPGLDGVIRCIPEKPPQNFDLEKELRDVDAFVLGAQQFLKYGTQNRWLELPFSNDSIHYPYGFIASTSKNPHGNIFTEDWRKAISAGRYSLKIGIPKDQKEHYNSQKLQLRSLI